MTLWYTFVSSLILVHMRSFCISKNECVWCGTVCLLMCECVISIGKWSVLTSHIKVLHRVDWALTNKSRNNISYYVQKIVCVCVCLFIWLVAASVHVVVVLQFFSFFVSFLFRCVLTKLRYGLVHSYNNIFIYLFPICLNVRRPWSNTLIELNINPLVCEQW